MVMKMIILSGKVGEAIATVEDLYPGLLQLNMDLSFRLKVRLMITMIMTMLTMLLF